MKLFFCTICDDVLKLQYQERRCLCGRSSGKYAEDGLRAELTGSAVPLGFANDSFRNALLKRPLEGPGRRFEAFVLPKWAPTVRERK